MIKSITRLRIILNRPLDRHCLWPYEKNIKKYKNHFGEEPCIYNKVRLGYEKWLGNLAVKEEAPKYLRWKIITIPSLNDSYVIKV